eukprot:1155299-Pelagomonas_calceolata.AAC.4
MLHRKCGWCPKAAQGVGALQIHASMPKVMQTHLTEDPCTVSVAATWLAPATRVEVDAMCGSYKTGRKGKELAEETVTQHGIPEASAP